MVARVRRSPRRGVSAIEYIIVALVVALAGVFGWRGLNGAYKCRLNQAIAKLAGTSSGPSCDEAGGAGGAIASNEPPSNACPNGSCMMNNRCFVAGTLVLTDSGPQPIESLVI